MRLCLLMLLASCATTPRADESVWLDAPVVAGTVKLLLTVNELGFVTAAKVLSGPGAGLDEAALDALLKARFKPVLPDGGPVASTREYAFTFSLDPF